jgi:hypothetical protein
MKATKDFYLDYAKTSKNPIPYSVYYKLIDDIHKGIADEIFKGWEYTLPHGLGCIGIKWFNRSKFKKDGTLNLPVNWAASNKLKAQIESDGLVPYKENEDGENNGGVKWLIYHEDDKVFSFHWSKGFMVGGIIPKIEQLLYFKFKATWHNNRRIPQEIAKYELPESIFKQR